jgi:hypothetical protein
LGQPDRFVQRIAAFKACDDADGLTPIARHLLSLKCSANSPIVP